jgi:hypothetical protein
MVDCKSLSKLKRSSAQMVKRGSELASICRYQGIVRRRGSLCVIVNLTGRNWDTNARTCFDRDSEVPSASLQSGRRSHHAASTMPRLCQASRHLGGSCGLPFRITITAHSTRWLAIGKEARNGDGMTDLQNKMSDQCQAGLKVMSVTSMLPSGFRDPR